MTEADVLELCVESGIPEHMHSAVISYVVDHLQPGGFLTAVLENNLMEAASRADSTNIQHLENYARLLYNLPRNCWGDPSVVDKWLREVP